MARATLPATALPMVGDYYNVHCLLTILTVASDIDSGSQANPIKDNKKQPKFLTYFFKCRFLAFCSLNCLTLCAAAVGDGPVADGPLVD